jgi:hypothetical protein
LNLKSKAIHLFFWVASSLSIPTSGSEECAGCEPEDFTIFFQFFFLIFFPIFFVKSSGAS